MKVLDRVWKWIYDNDKAILVTFAVIAGAYALFEYIKRERSNEAADSEGSRPRIRDDVAQHSDLISLGVPR
jgi:hypothetical protein